MVAGGSRRDRRELVEWLKRDFPRDVLMPVEPGTKRPAAPHKDGAWDWKSWDQWGQHHPSSGDVCVLLRDLCVLDIDTPELAEAFEARFPALRTVPCERTAKGKHYWFLRPEWADAEGFWDGSAQVEKHVDFKSVCRNGTSGVVVVAPSTGKAWERRPWAPDADLLEMPREILLAAAVPATEHGLQQQRVVSVTLRCADGSVERTDCRWVPTMAYLQPFLPSSADRDGILFSAPDDDDAGVPLPRDLVSAAPLRELFHVLDHGTLSGVHHPRGVSRAALRDVRRIADFLGLPAREIDRRLVACIPLVSQLDLAGVCPAWGLCATTAAQDMVPVDSALADALRYVPLRCGDGDGWLFGGRVVPGHALREGDRVLAADPASAAEARLVAAGAGVVCDVLRAFAGRVVLSGGATMWSVAAEGVLTRPSRHDYDLFVIADTDDEATEIAAGICAIVSPSRSFKTARAITLFHDDAMIQIVLRRHAAIRDVTRCFDLGPCKVTAWYDDEHARRLTIRAERDFVECMRHVAFWVELKAWSYSAIPRVIKYHHKGFDVFVPCTRRAAFREYTRVGYLLLHSLADLFVVEREFLEQRQRQKDPVVRPLPALRSELAGYPDDRGLAPLRQVVHDVLAQKAVPFSSSSSPSSAACLPKELLRRVHGKPLPTLYKISDARFIEAASLDRPLPRKVMEAAVRRRLVESVQFARMTKSEVVHYSGMCKSVSDYGSRLTLSGTLTYVAARAANAAIRFAKGLAEGAKGQASQADAAPPAWQTLEATMSRRRCVNLPALYDMPKLRSVLLAEQEEQEEQEEHEVAASLLSGLRIT